MRKNVKKQLALRVLSTAALVAMVSSIATAAFAAEYNVKDGSVEIVAKDGVQSITQWVNKDIGIYVQDDNGKDIRDREDSDIVLTTKGETTSNTVTITAEEKGDTANVTLEDVFINREGARNSDSEAALTVKGDGDTNIELNGNNTLSSTGAHAGLEKTDAECSGTLTITDDKNDGKNGGSDKKKDEYGYSTGGDTGTLAVIGGGSGGAGIGGQGGPHGDSRAQEIHDASNITITGGNISAGHTPEGCDYNAHWNPGAGIGGGSHGGDGTNITITGNANVDAYGSYYAAGIGGSDYITDHREDKSYSSGGNGENITISGNAKVTARGGDAAGIGGAEYGAGKNIQIKDNADVHAYSGGNGAGIGGGRGCGGEVHISGNATVTAVGYNGGAGIGSGDHDCNDVAPERRDTTVTISDNATVTAIGSFNSAGIGNGNDQRNVGKTDITITGGTITAIGGVSEYGSSSGCGIGGGKDYEDGSPAQNVTVTINGTTGNTTINASCTEDVKSAISKGNGTADIIGYDADGVSPFGEDHSVVVRMYKKGSLTLKDYDQNTHRYKSIDYNHGELYQTVHNRKYMEEHPEEIVDISKLKDDDLHAWQPIPGGEYKEPTLEEDGYVDCICGIDKCGQTKRVPLPKLTPEPSEPDTPSTPETPDTPDTPSTPDVPSTPEVTPADPAVTPDAPAQDGTAPADTPTADTTATAQNVAQNAEPEAAAAASTAAPAAAVLPQTGANWLAVVGTALSGLFLLAAGFVLDRKNRRMN